MSTRGDDWLDQDLEIDDTGASLVHSIIGTMRAERARLSEKLANGVASWDEYLRVQSALHQTQRLLNAAERAATKHYRPQPAR